MNVYVKLLQLVIKVHFPLQSFLSLVTISKDFILFACLYASAFIHLMAHLSTI